jgi:hypothetical protein
VTLAAIAAFCGVVAFMEFNLWNNLSDVKLLFFRVS